MDDMPATVLMSCAGAAAYSRFFGPVLGRVESSVEVFTTFIQDPDRANECRPYSAGSALTADTKAALAEARANMARWWNEVESPRRMAQIRATGQWTDIPCGGCSACRQH